MRLGAKWVGAAASIVTALCSTTADARRVVYLNAGPTNLVDTNGQDPTTNSISVGGFTPGPISGWPALTPADKDLLMFYMKEATVPFDITFTWERPAAGTYDMLVMGTEADHAALFEDAACSGPVGLRDCEDGQGENISFLFHGCMPADQQADLRRMAHTGLKALGYGWGLENVTVSGEVMGSYGAYALRFGNECVTVAGTSQCFHQGCPAGQQNSQSDLLEYIGARVDDGPPTIEITAPAHGSVVSSDFSVEASVDDLFGGLDVSLEIVEADQRFTDDEPPYRWNLTSVPDGTWTLRVLVIDADDNEASDEVVVCVGAGGCDPGQPGSDTGDDAGDDTDDTGLGDDTGSPHSGDGGLDPTHPSGGGSGATPAGSACHCRSEGTASWPGALALVLLAGLRRRSGGVTRGG
jgi:hypothetical protein